MWIIGQASGEVSGSTPRALQDVLDGGVEQLGEPGELGEGLARGSRRCPAWITGRRARGEQLRGGLDVGGARLERSRSPVAGRRAEHGLGPRRR